MKARDKLFIFISVVACGVSIAVFALVSLGHFIYSPGRTVIPVVGKMYESTVQQVALLEPIPVPQAPTPVSNPPKPPVPVNPTVDPNPSLSDNQAFSKKQLSKSQKNHKLERDFSYSDLQKAIAALFGELLR
jgi:hypothetical protein